MARPVNDFPRPSLRLVNNTYYIRWRYLNKQYEVSIGKVPKNTANAFCTITASALMDRMPWPDEIANSSAVLRFLQAKQSSIVLPVKQSLSDLIDLYFEKNHSSPNWNRAGIGHLRRFADEFLTLNDMTTKNCLLFLDATKKRASDSTRNRAKSALSGFISWLKIYQYRPESWNPLSLVKYLPEARPMNIPHCNSSQRDLICATVDYLKLPDAIAVWIALHAGLRSSEIARLIWKDIDLTKRRIAIRKSKTGKPRVVPISHSLTKRFQFERDLRKNEPLSTLVSCWNSPKDESRLTAGILREILCPRIMTKDELKRNMAANRKDKDINCISLDAINTEWRRILRCRQFAFKHGFCIPKNLPREICTWLAWRHTFGSLYAQKGVSLDKISAWMGNSPEVCRRHYAEFIPTDIIDPDIDRVC